MEFQSADNMIIRPAMESDFDAVLKLIKTQNLAGFGEPLITRKMLNQRWSLPNLDLTNDTWVTENQDGSLAGYADLIRNRNPVSPFFKKILRG